MVKLEQILFFLDETFDPHNFHDYPYALNGLQVGGKEAVSLLGAAVDASEEALSRAAARGVDLLLVHHGLFWGGLGPITGPRFRKVAALIRNGIALYSLHLPLDAHPEFGNNVLLLRSLGLTPRGRFGLFKTEEVGWWADCDLNRRELEVRLGAAVEGETRLIAGGPDEVRRVGVVTGGGASTLAEASRAGLDTLITGEVPHHAYHEAMELGMNLLTGGHYATETFGVKAVAERVSRDFDLPWEFFHLPTGL